MLFVQSSQTVINYGGSVASRQFGDFNGDGRIDLIFGGPRYASSPTAGGWSGEAQRFLMFTFDSLGRATDISNTIPVGATAIHAREGVAADFNGDGRADYFSANHGFDVAPFPGELNTLLLSSAGGGMVLGSVPQLNSFSHSADVGDIDNDGDIDILTGVFGNLGDSGSPAYFLMNDGRGNFQIGQRLDAQLGGLPMLSSKLVDVNGDGKLDLVAGNHGDKANTAGWVMLGDGRGGFTNQPSLALPVGKFGLTLTLDIVALDIDRDGDQDLILSQTRREPFYEGAALQVLANDGFGHFTDVTSTTILGGNPTDQAIFFVDLADFNGDGFLDLFPSHTRDELKEGEIYLNDGLGHFNRMTFAQLGITGVVPVPQDINGDGRADIVTFSRDLMTPGAPRSPDPITMTTFLSSLSTGPGGIDPALQGAAGFNEAYYLAASPDIAAALGTRNPTGLAHYLATGRSEGRLGFAPGATVRGTSADDVAYGREGNETLILGDGTNYGRGLEGNDSLVGGSGFDDLNGNQGNDTANGSAGEDWVVGGKDNDSLSGGADYDLVYGNLGNDTCNGDDGDDIVRGGQGNDIVNGGAGNDYVSGDKGDDTMTGGAGADIFHSFGDAGIDRVTDFSLAQGDRVQLDPGTVFTLSQVGADTVINMTGGGQMTLVGIQLSSLTGNWIFGA